jgi:hypothetical protein
MRSQAQTACYSTHPDLEWGSAIPGQIAAEDFCRSSLLSFV